MSKFIVIEGIDGSGKSTQAEKLSSEIPEAIVVGESTSTILGASLFNLIRDPSIGHISKPALGYMIAAARHQLNEKIIIPYLKEGRVVICDRYTPSGMVYGSIDCGLSLAHLYDLFPKTPQVEAVFLIDIKTSTAIDRLKDKKKDLFEEVNQRIIEGRRQL